jgi:hypothetical protein
MAASPALATVSLGQPATGRPKADVAGNDERV